MSPSPPDNPIKSEQMPLGEQIIEGLTQFRDALQAGDDLEKKFTVRSVRLNLDPQPYGAEEVKATRARLQASQAVFARLLGVSTSTVRSWEQGKPPPPMARRLLDLMNEDPEAWLTILREAAEEQLRAAG